MTNARASRLRPPFALRGRFVVVLAALLALPEGAQARRIGRVTEEDPGKVVAETRIGIRRLLEKLSGEQLPRIC